MEGTDGLHEPGPLVSTMSLKRSGRIEREHPQSVVVRLGQHGDDLRGEAALVVVGEALVCLARFGPARPPASAWRPPGHLSDHRRYRRGGSPASAGRSSRMQGRRQFLTLGGHPRRFSLTSLTYFRCSGTPLENEIGRKRTWQYCRAYGRLARIEVIPVLASIAAIRRSFGIGSTTHPPDAIIGESGRLILGDGRSPLANASNSQNGGAGFIACHPRGVLAVPSSRFIARAVSAFLPHAPFGRSRDP